MQNFPTLEIFPQLDQAVRSGPKDRPDFGSWSDDFKNIFQDAVDSGRERREAAQSDKGKVSAKEEKTDRECSLDEKISREEFSAVRNILAEAGVTEDQLKEIEKKLKDSGLSWKELLAGLDLDQLKQKIELTAGEKTAVLSFLSALGFNSQEGQTILGKLEHGQHSKVWEMISQRIENMPADKRLALSREQVAGFFKALGLDAGAMEKASGFIGRELGKSEIQNLIALIRKEALNQQTGDMMRELAAIKNNDSSASGRAGALLAELARLTEKQDGKKDTDEKAKELSFAKSKHENTGEGKGVQDKSLFERLSEKAEQGLQERSGQGSQSGTKEDPWEKFLSKIRTFDSSDQKAAAFAEARAGQTGDASRQRMDFQQRAYVSRQVLEQVQNGIFQRLNTGKTQLSLQLDPPDLGRVGVILQMKNNEVRALIRPSSPEVAQIVSDNLARLKTSLEQQGLKVSKIEVQTQTQENHGQTWQGQEEHNKARERMREAIRMARMRGLDSEGSSAAGLDGAAVSQGPESRDGPGLDIFA